MHTQPLCQQDGNMSPLQTDLLIPWSTITLGQETSAMVFSYNKGSMKISKSGITKLLSNTQSFILLFVIRLFAFWNEDWDCSKQQMSENKVFCRLEVCGTEIAASCLTSAVLSRACAPGQELPAFVQASAESRFSEVISLRACSSGCRASSGCRKMLFLCSAISFLYNCRRVI